MGKYLSIVGFAGLCVYVLWVLLADRPLDRINRTCAPLTAVSRTLASVGSLFSDQGEATGAEAGRDLYQTCRYVVFRQFYAELYAQMKRHQVGVTAKGEERQQEAER